MKKILALWLMLFSGMLFAKETVVIYYAFSPADNMANYSRTLVDEANKIQDKYTFVFDTKPGAGNAIAVNYVKNNPNSILATSSAYFIRPHFYPNESYNIDDFKELMPQCDAPIGIASSKYNSWADIPQNKSINIGVSGMGVTTHLIASQIIKKYPNIQVVPYKSTNDSMLAMVGGNIELTVGFLGSLDTWGNDNNKIKAHTLGITGSRAVNNYPTLLSQGFPTIIGSLNAAHHLVVPKTVGDVKFAEWRTILVTAAKSKSVLDSYTVDHCIPLSNMADSDIEPWYNAQAARWKRLTDGITLEK